MHNALLLMSQWQCQRVLIYIARYTSRSCAVNSSFIFTLTNGVSDVLCDGAIVQPIFIRRLFCCVQCSLDFGVAERTCDFLASFKLKNSHNKSILLSVVTNLFQIEAQNFRQTQRLRWGFELFALQTKATRSPPHNKTNPQFITYSLQRHYAIHLYVCNAHT